jgi:asparagine synthase (glutamine-hydrolysing)
MCGIAGILEFGRGRSPAPEALEEMTRVLAHRGPDDEGFYLAGPVGLGHRRLSIIDLDSGQQPMQSPDGQVSLVFNGEIYNYRELAAELERRGYAFRTKSDTEVLLALYLAHGLDAFAKLNGMFACAFWDGRSRQLVLARDRFGKKPLFYHRDAHRFLFGSEIKAILAAGHVERTVDLAALHEYLSLGYIEGERTILTGVHRLPPAHVLTVRDGEVRSWPWWALEFRSQERPPDESEAEGRVEELLRQAVNRRLVSDVPLGAFLSGGLDSSTVVALMVQLAGRVRTFTIGFEEEDYSELEDARVVARHLGTDHHEIVVKPSALDILPDLVWHLDEPFADSSAVPTYYVCQAARQHITVALSGDGGDEVFAGYRRYQELGRYRRMAGVPRWARRGIVRPLTRLLPFTAPGWNYLHALGALERGALPCELGLYPYIHDRLYSRDLAEALRGSQPFGRAERLLREARHLDPVSRYQYLDTMQYLPGDILTKVDRMSMANSLEVRSPLLDHTLVEYVATLPASYKLRQGTSKYLLRRIAQRLLPPSVLAKRKQGFAIPADRWFQRERRGFAEEILLDRKTLARGYFRPETLSRLLGHHASGRRDYSAWIWCLIVLELWHRLVLEGAGPRHPVHGRLEGGPPMAKGGDLLGDRRS